MQGRFRPDPRAHKKEHQEAVQRSRGSSNAGQFPAQSRQFEFELRSLASLAVWLDQEEELVQLVPEELPVLSKKLFQVIVICCGV
jgi:hypothetical protein